MLAVGLFAACGDPDVAPIPTFDGIANTTIAELFSDARNHLHQFLRLHSGRNHHFRYRDHL